MFICKHFLAEYVSQCLEGFVELKQEILFIPFPAWSSDELLRLHFNIIIITIANEY